MKNFYFLLVLMGSFKIIHSKKLYLIIPILLLFNGSFAQTTITTNYTSGTLTFLSGSNVGIVFAIDNSNSNTIAVTDIGHYTQAGNISTWTLWYNPTGPLTGAPSSINTANGWVEVVPSQSATNSGADGIIPVLTGIEVDIPANTAYRFALVSSNRLDYGSATMTPNSFTDAGVSIWVGNNANSPGYTGTFPNLTGNTPRFFYGFITFTSENEDCYSPKDLAMDNLTATTAQFSWTASADETNGYYWVVMASGDDPDVDLPVQDGNTATGIVTATATQLSQNTAYSIYVQTDCGSEISIWEGPLDFTTPIVPPSNDECADAIPLAIGVDFDDMPILGNNLGATHDPGDPLPTCAAFNFASNGKDIWYMVEVPAAGSFSVETRTNNYVGMNNTGMEIYSGTCGNIALIECNANDGVGDFSLIGLTGQTPGETLLVRVWGYNNDVGEFWISAYGDPLPCDKPSDISLVDVEDTIAEFSWSASSTETNGYVWAVMANGENPDTDTQVQSGTVGTGMTTTTVTGLSPANYYDFYVKADCGSDGLSYWEGPFSFTTATASVNDHELAGFTFYPNQMDDILYISAQTQIEKVMIFSLAGQKLIEQEVDGANSQIDVSGLASAPYFMKITTAKGNVGTYNLIKK